eukprot:CAMPEP_0183368654 /NCGR_PEP_ID=MMETSP0164_2-20130417/96717_1 /TAXON_ID=221442 /ORGANISM="Coccolithus pelagicus ssp braarudi, Strain PLY182g" /LENGTH=63 /DNA_ID=CAMNT_0025544785 /DNA_START=151 /DNA_END=340 /DNA_ORIENTATION=+
MAKAGAMYNPINVERAALHGAGVPLTLLTTDGGRRWTGQGRQSTELTDHPAGSVSGGGEHGLG